MLNEKGVGTLTYYCFGVLDKPDRNNKQSPHPMGDMIRAKSGYTHIMGVGVLPIILLSRNCPDFKTG